MTDPNTPTTSTNPQDLIDQALGSVATPGSTPTDTTEPTLPTPEPLSPPPATQPMVEQQKPEAEPTNAVPEPTAMPEPPKDVKPMGDDMPLAFASTATPVDTMTTTPPEPYVEPVNTAVVPPILAAPSAPNTSSKGKGAMSKIKMAVVALLAVLGITGGVGLYAYQRYGTVEPATIAVISDKTAAECSGCSCNTPGCGGGWLKMVGGQCKVSGICNSAKDSKNTEQPNNPITTPNNDTSCKASGGAWCTGCGGFCNMTKDQGCYSLQETKCGEGQVTGATYRKAASCNVGEKACTCGGGESYCFSKSGYCGDEANISDQTRLYGLCAITPNPSYIKKTANCNPTEPGCVVESGTPNTTNNGLDDDIADWFNNNGLKTEGVKNYYYCPGMLSNTQYGCSTTGRPVNMKCFCGTIQIDYGNGFESKTMKCGCDKPEPTPTPSTPTVTVTPTLMCTGLTHTPTTTPVIGDKLTFTCAGSSTPAGAVNLTYKFRYNLNNGAYVSMTNKTATTSELTIASCGTYKVQCQACGTINGVLTCDPIWTAATQ